MSTTVSACEFNSVSVQVDRGVATISVETGRQGNAMVTNTYQDLHEALSWCSDERPVRVVVIAGGKDDFSVGGDWAKHLERDVQNFREHLGLLFRISVVMRTMGKPIIAAVRGRCTGGMNQVALLADLTVAAKSAVFGQHGCRTGSFPIFWGTQLLPLAVGEKKAREIVMLSLEYTAEEALQMGLCNRVVDDADLAQAVRDWCDKLIEHSPRSLKFAKTSLNFGSDLRWSGVWHAREALAEFAETDEWEEAISSYLEGRPPTWAVETMSGRA